MLAPLRSVNDQRFSWLRNVFLKLFQDWLNSVQKRQGNFERDAGQKMFISIVEQQTYEGLKALIQSLKLPKFFFDIRLSMYWQKAFKNWFGRHRSLGSMKDNPSIADFRYNNNAITNQKNYKPIANGTTADSTMIALTDEPLPCWKPKKEWKFKCKSWIKKLINCCFSQIKTKHKLANSLILF